MVRHEELIAAVRRGSLPAVRQLLTADSGLAGIADEKGNTPLHYAAASGHTGIVQLLLEHDANINAIVKKGGTPINYAAEHGQVETVRALLERGADLHIGSGPGHWAYYSETRQEAVLGLLRHSRPVADLMVEAGPICEATEEYILTKVERKTVPAMQFLYVGTDEAITHEGISQADNEAGVLMAREQELLRRGPLTWVYHSFSSGISSYLEPPGCEFYLNMGFPVGSDAQISEGRVQVGELSPIRVRQPEVSRIALSHGLRPHQIARADGR